MIEGDKMYTKSISIDLQSNTVDDLVAFSKILNKDINVMVKEAIDEYLVRQQEKLMEQSLYDDNAMTNLDYDEFWSGVEV